MTGIISHDDDDPMTSSVTAPFKNRIDRERFIAIQQRSAVKRAIRPVTARKLATPPEEHSTYVTVSQAATSPSWLWRRFVVQYKMCRGTKEDRRESSAPYQRIAAPGDPRAIGREHRSHLRASCHARSSSPFVEGLDISRARRFIQRVSRRPDAASLVLPLERRG